MNSRQHLKVSLLLPATAAACAAIPNIESNDLVASQGITIANTHSIEGYADRLSAAPGDSIQFSVHSPNSAYALSIYKYGTDGGPQLMAGPYSCANGAVRDYSDTAYRDGAGWPASFALTVPAATGTLSVTNCSGSSNVSAWASGLYVARLETASNPSSDVTFVVKDAPVDQKNTLLLASTNTWNAYNFWPSDSSFYSSDWSAVTAVNFNRPNPYATPEVIDEGCTSGGRWKCLRTEHLAAGENRLARWFNRNGRPYSMATDLDVNDSWNAGTKTSLLDSFDTVVLSTHSEYWSDNMYKALTEFLARGGNLVSVSGNTAYRRVLIDGTTKTMTKANPENRPPRAIHSCRPPRRCRRPTSSLIGPFPA